MGEVVQLVPEMDREEALQKYRRMIHEENMRRHNELLNQVLPHGFEAATLAEIVDRIRKGMESLAKAIAPVFEAFRRVIDTMKVFDRYTAARDHYGVVRVTARQYRSFRRMLNRMYRLDRRASRGGVVVPFHKKGVR